MPAHPPTKVVLQQRIRRATLQGGHYWGHAAMPYRQLPSRSEWGGLVQNSGGLCGQTFLKQVHSAQTC